MTLARQAKAKQVQTAVFVLLRFTVHYRPVFVSPTRQHLHVLLPRVVAHDYVRIPGLFSALETGTPMPYPVPSLVKALSFWGRVWAPRLGAGQRSRERLLRRAGAVFLVCYPLVLNRI